MKLLKSLYSPLRVGFIHYLLVSFLAGLVLISYIFTVTDTSFVDTLGGGILSYRVSHMRHWFALYLL